MCLGAIYWARLSRIVYANTRQDAAAIGFADDHIYHELALPLADRSLPIEPLLHDEAQATFHLWQQKADRTEY